MQEQSQERHLNKAIKDRKMRINREKKSEMFIIYEIVSIKPQIF